MHAMGFLAAPWTDIIVGLICDFSFSLAISTVGFEKADRPSAGSGTESGEWRRINSRISFRPSNGDAAAVGLSATPSASCSDDPSRTTLSSRE